MRGPDKGHSQVCDIVHTPTPPRFPSRLTHDRIGSVELGS